MVCMVACVAKRPQLTAARGLCCRLCEQDVERDWKPRGYSCDLFVDPPGAQAIDQVSPS